MPETKPTISKSEINRAGDTLITAYSESEEYSIALEIVHRWRSSHEIPLNELSVLIEPEYERKEDREDMPQKPDDDFNFFNYKR